jgi:hypothetical protein
MAPHYDEADIPDVNASCACSVTSLDLKANNINRLYGAPGLMLISVILNYLCLIMKVN